MDSNKSKTEQAENMFKNIIELDMTEEGIKHAISEAVGDGGTIQSEEYDLSELVVSTNEDVAWMPDYKQVGLFGNDVYSDLNPIDTIRIVDQPITGHRGDNINKTTVYELSSSSGGLCAIGGEHVDAVANELNVDVVEMLKNSRINNNSSPGMVIVDLPIGRLMFAVIDYEQEVFKQAKKRADTELGELDCVDGWDRKID